MLLFDVDDVDQWWDSADCQFVWYSECILVVPFCQTKTDENQHTRELISTQNM